MLISVRVIPRSSKNGIEWEQGKLKVRLDRYGYLWLRVRRAGERRLA